MFTNNVKEVGFVRSAINEGSLKKHPCLKSSNISLGSGSVAFEVVGEPSNLPTLMPIRGQIVKLEFDKVKKQCSKCFKFRHTRSVCRNDAITVQEYKKQLLKFLEDREKKTKAIPKP
ncbi:Hypothetical protein FKW44_025082, partial [Caligus rogercresseyi]